MKQNFHFEEFTEENYLRLLQLAKTHYQFAAFHDRPEAPHVLWRHDVDYSPHRALKLAQLEAEAGVSTTYFLLLHSSFYNLLEKSVFQIFKEIDALGHHLGLHFDIGFYGGLQSDDALLGKMSLEKNFLESILNTPIRAVSFHNPDVGRPLPKDEFLSGMINAYSARMREEYDYCSDSNGYWRYQRLEDMLEKQESPRLQILTHPEWWVPSPMSPRERIARCIDGRAAAQHHGYDAFLKTHGRENIGSTLSSN